MSVLVKEKFPIPLFVQVTDGRSDLIIEVDVFNASTNELVASNVRLDHVSSGLYNNYSIAMPNVTSVNAQYKVYENLANPPISIATDVFIKNDLADDAVNAGRTGDLIGTIDISDELAGVSGEETLIAIQV